MKCDIRNCESESTYIITTKMNTKTMVCSTHLKRIIDGVEKLSMRSFVGIQSIAKERVCDGTIQTQIGSRETSRASS